MTRATLLALAGACIAIALLFIRPAGEPGVFMRDFEAYWSAGRAALAHADPYAASLLAFERDVPGVSATRAELLPFIGAPAALPLWMLFARMPYTAAATTWSIVLGLAFAVVVVASVRLCGTRIRSLDAVAALFCALAFVPITSDFVLGQPALVGCAAGMLVIVGTQRSFALATFGALFGSVQPNVALPSVVALTTRRGLAALASAGALLYVAGAAALGFAWPARYAGLLAAHATAERHDVIQYTPAAIAFGFGAGARIADTIGTIVALVAASIALVALVRATTLAQRFVIASAALPLVCGFAHEHDLVLAFLPALWAMRTSDARNQPFAIAAFGLLAVNWLNFAQQPQAVAQDLLLAAGALLAALAWCTRRTPAHFAAALFVFALVACGALIGARYHAPIWPNDMTPFNVSYHATAAQIWQLEQVHTGLERTEPAWSLLRGFALAGSAGLLWIVAARATRYRPS